MMLSIMSGSLIRETPPWARMSAGTRSSAMTATAPASSAIFAWSAVTTSMMTPPLSISAMPRFTRAVPVTVPDGVAVLSTVDTGASRRTVGSRPILRPRARLPIRSNGRTHARSAGQRRRAVVVHLEGPRLRRAPRQARPPDPALAAHATGVGDRVVVEPPRQPHAVAGRRQPVQQAGRHRVGAQASCGLLVEGHLQRAG